MSIYTRALLLSLSIFFSGNLQARRKAHALSAKKTTLISKKNGKRQSSAGIHVQEAKLVDIPIPLSSQLATDSFEPVDASVSVLSYNDKKLTSEQIKTFFQQEMERLGWLAKESYESDRESVFRFKKPSRSCILSIKSAIKKGSTNFTIFCGSLDSAHLAGTSG